jgi:major membrane immunogen (membrane-anchored lipoprotein)
MKHFLTLSVVMSALFLSSCEKSEHTKVKIDIPDVKTQMKSSLAALEKPGFKCDLVGEVEKDKKVFITLDKKEGKTTASFHDFTSPDMDNTVIISKFEGFNLMFFFLSPSNEDEKVLVGEGALTHSNHAKIEYDGKVISITGRLTLYEDMSGVIEQKQMLMKEDHSMEITSFEELATIENCEPFKAMAF